MIFFGNITIIEYGNGTTEIPPVTIDDSVYIIVPLLVIIGILVLSFLVYLMLRRRRMTRIRREIAKLYEFDSNDQEWDSLNSYEIPSYNSLDYTATLESQRNTTNL
ncbi:hypothetical protein GWI33_023181 [Rhynchophorus ferrugineus]|uniref:Uncharacterized protein n=1 Tax=Rhynchophorus ferrugineus TaxID=354439 RepID=A0A834IND1_RHYFE|nr:hypothetical protein GWI33_023181 [Rhynchophorus ferrugineus]